MYSKQCETDFAENHYYRLNQIFLSMLNLWPCQRSKFAKINCIFHYAIMLSFISVQLTSFLTFQLSINNIVMVLSYATPAFLYIIQYYAFHINSNAVKQMWKNIHDSWNLLKNNAERDIMRQFSSTGELHTKLIALSVFVALFLYGFFELIPTILNIIFPLNETRPSKIHAMAEYFVDQEKYFHAIFCHWLIGISFGGFVFVSTSTLQLVYLQHICGLLKIASYRMEHSLDKYILCNSTQEKDMAIQNICAAVNIHRRALECSKFFMVTFAQTFFFIIIIAVVSLSLNLFRLLMLLILLNDINELLTRILFIELHFLLMFIFNYYGQRITDYNNEVFEQTYNIQWYIIPVKIQKLLLFIMQNTTKLYVLNIGQLYIISLEGFTKLTSLSISYFTVLYSLL